VSSVKVATNAVLPKQDPTYVNRIVGYNEYRKSLEYLDTLVANSTAEELEAIDAFIKQHDEFAVITNLSPRWRRQQTLLAESPNGPQDNFERRGLDWMMALARIEVGAMLAGFTSQPQPFVVVRPSKLELNAYRELLLDGVRSHFFAMRSDPLLVHIAKGKGRDRQNLAYGRRVFVTLSMLDAMATLYGQTFAPPQVAELYSWKNELEKTRDGIVGVIAATMMAASGDERERWDSMINGCSAMKRGVQSELAAGTATVNPR